MVGNFLDNDIKLNEVSPLTFAFVGDAVYELLVREYIVGKGNCPVKKLHRSAVEYVKAEAQAKVLRRKVLPVLTDEESQVCQRGRNAHVSHVPKGASVSDYHSATALEVLFGYLYLAGNMDRIKELFAIIIAEENN